MRALLSWIYTGATTPIQPADLPHLLHAASFYLLPDLHAECMRMATAALSVHNALEWLLYALEHLEAELKAVALEYVASSYYRMRQQRPMDSADLLRRLNASYADVSMELMDGIAAAYRRRLDPPVWKQKMSAGAARGGVDGDALEARGAGEAAT